MNAIEVLILLEEATLPLDEMKITPIKDMVKALTRWIKNGVTVLLPVGAKNLEVKKIVGNFVRTRGNPTDQSISDFDIKVMYNKTIEFIKSKVVSGGEDQRDLYDQLPRNIQNSVSWVFEV